MKTTSLIILLIVLAIAVILAATNPTTQQYSVFLNASLMRALDHMEQQETSRERQIIRDILKSEGKKVIESLALTNTVRKNFGLFSLFETNAFGVRVQVLGIATTFVPLEDEQELSAKLGQLIL